MDQGTLRSQKPIYMSSLWYSQSIKFLERQYPWQSQAQWRDSWISVQQQNWWNTCMASMGYRVGWCLWGKDQVKEMCREMFLEANNWNGCTDRQRQVVLKRWGTRVKSSCASVGLDPRDRQTYSFVWSQWTGWEWCSKHGVRINRLFTNQQTYSHVNPLLCTLTH